MLSLKGAVRTRRLKLIALRVAVLVVLLFVLGFGAFAWGLPDKQVELNHDADGIVVLTGGTSRVTDALELLAANRGKRLLITGVNPGTTNIELAREFPQFGTLFASRIDLDYSAINTRDNAMQTRVWADHKKIHSLIVVTSAYHMPRALAELAHQMPNVTMTPFPVLSDRLRAKPWWSDGGIARLVVLEYFKYLFAQVRMRFDSLAPDPVTGQKSNMQRS